jgi:ADP-ribosyl-[dinitrogen reductase] hydrolase
MIFPFKNKKEFFMHSHILFNKALGGFWGLALGDALGAQVEFMAPDSFPRVTDMTGGGVFNLGPGQITDDTIMSILSAKSLIECQGFNPIHMMSLFSTWSSSSECFDIGNTILEAIYAFKRTGLPYQGREEIESSGNGSLMRIYPSIVWTLGMNMKQAFKLIWDTSRLTHATSIVREVSMEHTKIIRKILLTNDQLAKEEILDEYELVKNPKSTGYVLDTFNCALWAFANSDSFEEGLLKVVNLGGDADTVGSVYGQLAGSYYGADLLPERFLVHLKEKGLIEELVRRLLPQ